MTSKLNGYIRWGHDADDWIELFQSSQFLKGPTGDLTQDHPAPGHGILGSLTYAATPTLINQFTWSKTLNHWSWFEVDPAAVNRDVLKGATGTPQAGQALPSLFPLHAVGPGVGGNQLVEGKANASNGYSNYMPNLTFGGPTPNAPSYANGNPEYSNNNIVDTATDNLSKVWGAHSIKGGAVHRVQPEGSAVRLRGMQWLHRQLQLLSGYQQSPQHRPWICECFAGLLRQLYRVDGQNHRE